MKIDDPGQDHDREPPVQESDRDQLVKTLMEIDDPDQDHDREPPVQESDRDQLIQQIREFHERISQTVRQLNESNTVRENLVVQELWGQVLEDLRSECAESFEIVMQVKSDQIGAEIDQNYRQKKTEQLKLLMASTVCALWLHITPRDHEEFDDIKELFFSTLDEYIEIFRIKNRQNSDKNCRRGASIELEKTVRELMGEYPTVANTKKMRKIAQRILLI
ncbi:hypothetical protein niasHS_000808 [Heterodera schachtii]|uniref:Uncharacterized protein n=1 Tax=Heterodera schachtii TaxID=97005 RepID=A0ABD2K8F8_HETSC